MHKPKHFYWWLLCLSLVLPLAELIVFSIIYSSLSEVALLMSASYFPISIISVAFFLYLMMSTRNRSAKRYLLQAYIVCISATIGVSVFLHQLPPWVVSNFVGGIILLGGTLLAYITRPRENPFSLAR